MLSKIYGIVSSWLEPIIHQNIFKRRREITVESDLESNITPPKKRRVLHDITREESKADLNPILKKTNFKTFGHSSEGLNCHTPEKAPLEIIDLESEWFRTPCAQSNYALKENRQTQKLRLKNTSPYKKSLRPPMHCKSPIKSNNRRMSEGSDEVIFEGVVKRKSRVLSPIKPTVDPTPSLDDGTRSNPKPANASKSSAKRPSNFLKHSTPNDGTMSHVEYSQVLGSFIRSTRMPIEKPAPPKERKPIAVYDLTSDGSNSSKEQELRNLFRKNAAKTTIDLTRSDSGAKSFDVSESHTRATSKQKRQIAFIDLTKNSQSKLFQQPVSSGRSFVDLTESFKEDSKKILREHSSAFITLDESSEDDDDVRIEEVYHKRVEKVNSLQRELKKIPCTSPDWISKISDNYKKKIQELEEDRKQTQKFYEEVKGPGKIYYEQWLTKRLERHCQITGYVLPIEEEGILPELTPEIEAQVLAALKPEPSGELLGEGFGYQLRRRDIYTLKGLNWLNDEVINFYMSLLMDRGKSNKYLSVYAFNTFFYPKLIKQGHPSLKRWTRKVDIFAHDLIVVPVHLQMHWCLAIIDLRKKMISYYDSMGHPNYQCLSALLEYLCDEYQDKKGDTFDKEGWRLENLKDIPQQKNGSDCGMFACTFAEFACRDAPFNFSQDNMPYFRKKMVYEILTSKLLIK